MMFELAVVAGQEIDPFSGTTQSDIVRIGDA
jgi:hypothetical protein